MKVEPAHKLAVLVLFICVTLVACAPLDSLSKTSSSPESIRARGKLVVTVSLYPPFVYRDAAGNLIGYDIELAEAIAHKLGVPLVLQEVQFTSLIPSVEKGIGDIAVGALYITPARQALIDFSQPYLETGIVLVARKDSRNSVELNGKVIGVKTGATSEKVAQALKNNHHNITIKSYREAADYLQDLAHGHLDYALNDLINQLEYNKTHPDIVIVGEKMTTDSLGIAVKKGNYELVTLVNSVIADNSLRGVDKTLYIRWLTPIQP